MKQLVNLVLASVIAVPVFGQTSPKPPNSAERAQRQVKALTTLLNLTSAQQQQATSLYTSAAKAEQAVHQSEKDVQESLHNAIKNNGSVHGAGDLNQGEGRRCFLSDSLCRAAK